MDRNPSLRTTKALWLPTIWLWIIGSRAVSQWLGMAPSDPSTAQNAEGSPLDAVVFAILLTAGLVVLFQRSRQARAAILASWPCAVYFGYCLLSALWSDYPGLAAKRWIKAIGDLVMVIVVVTEPDLTAAVERLITRAGYLLMPLSILLIKYYNDLGRGYDPSGNPMNTGVTTNKNMLGVITLVISLGAVWRLLNTLRARRGRPRKRALIARVTLVVFCLAVLTMAKSATSIACFSLGTTLILATNLPLVRRRPRAIHMLVGMLLFLGGCVMFFGGQGDVAHALGRQSNLTGRTQIWAAVIPVCPNPLLGAGFESFWMGPRLEQVYSNLSRYMHVNEAHDGYIEVYLNLGLVGVGLIAGILISGYNGSVAAFRRDPAVGSLMLAYVAAAAVYSVSEAGFRMLDPMWMFLLLAVVVSHTVASRGRLKTSKSYPGLREPDRAGQMVASL
jgi:hypothetical protein